MWRWIIRIYVSLMVFLVFLFVTIVAIRAGARLLVSAGSPMLIEWLRGHVLSSAFLTGMIAGFVPVGSSLTGEGWFRSKNGSTFEGFKLEEIRPWTWLILSPIFFLGVVVWCLEQSQSVLWSLTLASFYHNFLMPTCSDVWARGYWFNQSCNMQLLFVASWVSAIGYSLAPFVRRSVLSISRSDTPEQVAVPIDDAESNTTREQTGSNEDSH
jgi:hypothetical protein